MKSFASDNYSGIHPEIFEAIQRANNQHQISYGEDFFTEEANEVFEKVFGPVTVLYTFNGTGANVTCLKCCTLPFQAVVCSEYAHILADECGAPTQSIGCSLLPLKTADGKLTPDMIKPLLNRIGNVHNTQPRVISISQSTEVGTVYSIAELKALCDFAHENEMYVHLDGARISNAVAALGVGLKEATVDCGVDIMSFGGTKNGLMVGEAVLIFNDELKANAPYFHKQTAQLFSKNRFISAQFTALLSNNLWWRMATHANEMAQLLASKVKNLPNVKITRSVDANAVFVIIPEHVIQPLRAQYPFYEWDAELHEQRWMSSFDTTEEDVIEFTEVLKKLL
ncbi:L-threonine aldolase [Paludibacter propionicigenes WB4]|uniref:L-threonine aldolase n=1 Tax=Paludibacter propionicigenes (strain DSM 17365 / JCM 13257 / WB4) TaxID=694427 RepID=E4T202_PALPW|nr:low specificity L-threonine aldolase [Paludibacter propionicigenes]ADQ78746.1 L-threonine aldolase [Paludibacter propionicigenes WB4]